MEALPPFWFRINPSDYGPQSARGDIARPNFCIAPIAVEVSDCDGVLPLPIDHNQRLQVLSKIRKEALKYHLLNENFEMWKERQQRAFWRGSLRKTQRRTLVR